jgi:hypothetical protein
VHAALYAALDDALNRRPPRHTARYVVVDLAGVTFCCVRGFALLADISLDAAASASGFAFSGLTPSLERHAQILWAGRGPIRRYPTAALAIAAIRANQVADHPA